MVPAFENLCLLSVADAFASSLACSLLEIPKCINVQISSVCSWLSLCMKMSWKALREYLLLIRMFYVKVQRDDRLSTHTTSLSLQLFSAG